ncbi:CinA family nicotinamide mononucleotide deamidase-related protein [Dermatobacter hominis]|uniref:CinA family nicotinamide mononucleotide deamidase-related protein n=1 Tax=Dermatobacter hominis TaxID=2884263 RepID=UPI001D115FA0|nr:CinA family nicotinamide mononucleotide deamidase-related protein [Dermatobacter hominis]UDY36821.1 CinA family nicotinamide mononucleotide deamidase-related protein [Dermatobacter hominis]
MRVEVVAVGTELLLGQIVDSNSSWIGEQLALAGLDSYFQTKVGDNLGRIVDVIELALSRSDAVICTGGLGPTQDDLTREAIAAVMGVPLEESEEAAERIIAMFGGRGRRMPMNNLRQAMKPVGAEFIPQQPGTAPGLVCPVTRPDATTGEPVEKVIYAVPGVPWEMQEMVSGTVLPDLQRRAGITSVIASRTLRTWGESESGLAEILADRLDELDRLAEAGEEGTATIAFLASGMEGLKVRLTAKAPTEALVAEVLRAEEAVVRGILGEVVFGVDDDTMESVVLDLLRERSLTLGVAESLTGGMVGSRICDVAGASDVFRGSIVSYASDVKFDLLGVPEGPVVTEEAARAMALGARRVLGTDVGIAATGVAGPDEQEGRPAGTVCMAVAIGDPGDPDSVLDSIEVRLPGRRRQVREFTVISLLGLLRRHLVGI